MPPAVGHRERLPAASLCLLAVARRRERIGDCFGCLACWRCAADRILLGSGAASRGARILLIAAAVGSVTVGLVPEDVNLSLHVLGAFLGIVVGNCGFVLAGLIKRSSSLGRLRSVTLPLSILVMATAVLLFTGTSPAGDFGGIERLAVFPLRCWMIAAGIFLLHDTGQGAGAGPASRTATRC